jgi:hypothetical protein
LEVWRTSASHRRGVFIRSVFWGWWGGAYILKSEEGLPHPILALMVRPSPVEGAWSRVAGGSPGIRLVFMSVVLCQSLRLSLLVMVVALVHRFLGALARWLPAYLLQKALLRQALPSSGDGGARMAAQLRLVLMSIVVARWSEYLFAVFITFELFILLLMIVNRLN